MDVVFCHLIGDYVLQSDYIARTKGQNMYHLWVHSLLYCLPFCILFHDMHWKTFAILYLSHFVTDLLKARYNFLGYLEDQLIHYGIAFWLFWVQPF